MKLEYDGHRIWCFCMEKRFQEYGPAYKCFIIPSSIWAKNGLDWLQFLFQSTWYWMALFGTLAHCRSLFRILQLIFFFTKLYIFFFVPLLLLVFFFIGGNSGFISHFNLHSFSNSIFPNLNIKQVTLFKSN